MPNIVKEQNYIQFNQQHYLTNIGAGHGCPNIGNISRNIYAAHGTQTHISNC
jgi:hypothetical protein